MNNVAASKDTGFLRGEIAQVVLDDVYDDFYKSLYEDMRNFYLRAINQENPDLIVTMARKSWCMGHVLAEFESNNANIIHDKVLTPWFNDNPESNRSEMKVALLDDTYLFGRAVDDCIRRLVHCYEIKPENITLYVYAMQDTEKNRKKVKSFCDKLKRPSYTVKYIENKGGDYDVCWGGSEDTFQSEEFVRACSQKFVEAIHASGEPYLATSPAFILSYNEIRQILGDIDLNDKATLFQSHLNKKSDFSNPEKYVFQNITTQQMHQWNIEAFMLTPKETVLEKYTWIPNENIKAFQALRFYIYRRLGRAILTPYVSFKAFSINTDLSAMYPNDIQYLFNEQTNVWSNREGQIAAHRLLRYAISYIWGKNILRSNFDITEFSDRMASKGGICSTKYFCWLDNKRVYDDLKRIWALLSESGHVINDVAPHNDDLKIFNEAFEEEFTDEPVNYAKSLSSLFRKILEKERAQENDIAFRGITVKYLKKRLSERFCIDDYIISAAVTMMCDDGAAITRVIQHGEGDNAVIGTFLVVGEQSCHSLYNTRPSYAFFLKQLMRDENAENFVLHNYDDIYTKVHEHFTSKLKEGYKLGLPQNQLMKQLYYVKENITARRLSSAVKKLVTYHALSHQDAFDSSSDFFTDLINEIPKSE
jgi:hypothetical protein